MMMEQKTKIPIRIDWSKNEEGADEIEIVMNTTYFFQSNTSIRTRISKFKKMYLKFIKDVKEIRKNSKIRKSKKNGSTLSTTETWRLCKLLSDFNDKVETEFEITNYKEVYSREIGLTLRYINLWLNFGRNFKKKEVLDVIPVTYYMSICWNISFLKKHRLFNKEKRNLNKIGKEGKIPSTREYRKHIQSLMLGDELK